MGNRLRLSCGFVGEGASWHTEQGRTNVSCVPPSFGVLGNMARRAAGGGGGELSQKSQRVFSLVALTDSLGGLGTQQQLQPSHSSSSSRLTQRTAIRAVLLCCCFVNTQVWDLVKGFASRSLLYPKMPTALTLSMDGQTIITGASK